MSIGGRAGGVVGKEGGDGNGAICGNGGGNNGGNGVGNDGDNGGGNDGCNGSSNGGVVTGEAAGGSDHGGGEDIVGCEVRFWLRCINTSQGVSERIFSNKIRR